MNPTAAPTQTTYDNVRLFILLLLLLFESVISLASNISRRITTDLF